MQPGDVTLLLRRLAGEDDEARKQTYDRLISLVYDDLRRRAREQMRNEWDWRTLQPTALVHEAYERLIHYDMDYENRNHFLNVAAAAMRRLLIDYARSKKSAKRWGNKKRTLLENNQSAIFALQQRPEELIDIDNAVQTLRPEQVRLVELRYFLGLTMEETAAAMQVQEETLKKRWRVVKLLLYDKLKGSGDDASS
jgi:RNA polymerase sigma factor (TIGR02999 family)